MLDNRDEKTGANSIQVDHIRSGKLTKINTSGVRGVRRLRRKQERQSRELHDRTIALQEQAALNQANADARIKEEMRRHR